MSEIRLYVTTTESKAEEILDVLSAVFGEEDFAIGTTEIDEKKDIWEASIYMMAEDEAEVHSRVEEALRTSFPDARLQREVIPDVDWVVKSLEGLKPVRAGRFLVHGSHDRDKVRSGDIAIEIDAVVRSRPVRNALDLGTGSGVLAIAVRKLRNIPVLATDIDPIATKVAAENVRRNGIASGIVTRTAPGFHSTAFSEHGPFDLIIANILARPLIRMAPKLAAHLAPGGSVILSGILAGQRWKVIAAYSGARLRHVRTIWRNGWVTIHFDRP